MPPPKVGDVSALGNGKFERPYCDLRVQEIVVPTLDHDAKRLYLCSIIANFGTSPPRGPILVHTTVIADLFSAKYGWRQEFTQEWQWYTGGTTLPFRTNLTSAELHYVEEGGGAYSVLVQVGDPENHAGNINGNIHTAYMQCPPTYKPATFNAKMQGPLRRETRMDENGKFTSTLTVGGKPLKGGR